MEDRDRYTNPQDLRRANTYTALGGAMGALGQVAAGFGEQRSSLLRATVLSQNAEILRVAARDAQIRGANQADAVRAEASRIAGESRAALASNGILIDEDSALDLVQQTAGVGAVDALRTLAQFEAEANRYQREADITEIEASSERSIGRASMFAGLASAGQTVLGTANKISNRIRRYGGAE